MNKKRFGMMKQVMVYVAALVAVWGCGKSGAQPQTVESFVTEVRLKTTPVKDQGASSFCWVYAMLATIETEHLMQGDSVNLSPDYVGRMFLREQLLEKCRTASQQSVTTRGVGSMLLQLIQTYGVVHADAYQRKTNCDYNVLCRKLDQLSAVHDDYASMSKKADKLLDDAIGPAPSHVFMAGCEYTALEFAHSVCREDEYESLTSFLHHPFGSRFPLEVADNRYHDIYLNVPIDTLMQRIEVSLRNGHPVCWEGDTSEPGFSATKGIAQLQHDNRLVTQEYRQQSFESGKTTDDHCMEIVGIAHDIAGKRYFIMKNSWGTGNPYGGFIYVSENYVRLKTIAVFINQNYSS